VPNERGLASGHADEPAIIAQCLAGDRKAYAILVERYKGLVHDLVYRMVGDAARAEDIAQDAFVKAYLSLRQFRGQSRFSTWLCRIALNRCKDLLRKASREVLMPAGPDGELDVPDSADEGETPAVSLERREREAVLRRALARLPTKYREAVVLRHMEEMDFKEIGTLLGIPAGAAKVRTFRGREMLRKLLERGELGDDAI
jgi:RNA polymerase sigma-70 factor (ECF subfamily)